MQHSLLSDKELYEERLDGEVVLPKQVEGEGPVDVRKEGAHLGPLVEGELDGKKVVAGTRKAEGEGQGWGPAQADRAGEVYSLPAALLVAVVRVAPRSHLLTDLLTD